MSLKIKTTIYLCLFLLASTVGYAQTTVYDTVKVDFGSSLSEGTWNNFIDGTGAGELTMLKNTRDLFTGIGINVYDRFNGINTGGTTSPDSAFDFPSTATSDSYFGNVVAFGGNTEPTGAMLISGLNPAKTYTFEVFASRSASDNRETKYKFTGATVDSASLNPSNNTGNTVTVSLQPTAEGTIDLTVSPGENNDNSYKFYYLGALKMIYEQEAVLPPAITLNSPNGGEELTGESGYSITWSPVNLTDDVVLSYSTNNGSTWNEIATVSQTETTYSWTVPDVNSTTSLVQVVSGTASDQSDSVFTIVPSTGLVYDTVNIDFGTDVAAEGWNSFTAADGTGEIAALINSSGTYSGIGVNMIDRFNGINTNGATTPDANLGIPASVSSRSYYGNTSTWAGREEPTAEMVFTGLSAEKEYTFEFFASRMGVSDNRETKYKLVGSATDSVYLDAANNSTDVATLTAMPTAEGTINVIVSAGENNSNSYKFYYLNALRVTYAQGGSGENITVTHPNGGEVFTQGTEEEIAWASSGIDNVTIEYSADNGETWNTIGTASAADGSYTWTVPEIDTDEALVRVSDSENAAISDVSNNVFSIDYPLDGTYRPLIVVLGSSTAAGSGASSSDSSWVGRYRHFVQSKDQNAYVVNLAVGGYNSYDIMPSDFTQPSNRPAPEPEHNITKALTYNPTAILINLPSNDAASNYTITEQVFNMRTVTDLAASADVPVWVTTTQPRNFTESQRANLIEMRDSILAIYGDHAINIFDTLATETGTVRSELDSGDGTHLNDAGHKIIADAFIEAEVWETITGSGVSIETNGLEIPTSFEIKNNYPNPFNPATNIEFSIPVSSSITIRVYDITGREVSLLADGRYAAGNYNVTWDASQFATGMYVYRITARGEDNSFFTRSMKMMLIK